MLVLLAMQATSPDKIKFDWKPVEGQKATYATTNSHDADLGGGPVKLNISWNSVISVKKIEGKNVHLDFTNDEPKATVDGGSDAGINVQIPDRVEVYELDGKFVPETQSEHSGPEVGLFAGFLLPKTAIEAGEEYEVEGMKAKYIGTEKVGDWNTHKFTFTFLKGKSKDDLWTEGTIWLSTGDLSLVKRTAVFHNIDFGMGNESVINEIVRTK